MTEDSSASLRPRAAGLRSDDLGFRRAMRSLASAVVMVTVSVDERPWGLTISSCRWLGTMPPRILMSLGSGTVTCRQILAGGEFGVAVLGAPHDELAARGAAAGEAKFVDEYCEESDWLARRASEAPSTISTADCWTPTPTGITQSLWLASRSLTSATRTGTRSHSSTSIVPTVPSVRIST